MTPGEKLTKILCRLDRWSSGVDPTAERRLALALLESVRVAERELLSWLRTTLPDDSAVDLSSGLYANDEGPTAMHRCRVNPHAYFLLYDKERRTFHCPQCEISIGRDALEHYHGYHVVVPGHAKYRMDPMGVGGFDADEDLRAENESLRRANKINKLLREPFQELAVVMFRSEETGMSDVEVFSDVQVAERRFEVLRDELDTDYEHVSTYYPKLDELTIKVAEEDEPASREAKEVGWDEPWADAQDAAGSGRAPKEDSPWPPPTPSASSGDFLGDH